jgi:hypothetical protein
VQVRPLTPTALAGHVVDRAHDLGLDHPVRVAIDGPPQADPGRLADAIAAAVRETGRPAIRIRVDEFLRSASVRFEAAGRTPTVGTTAGSTWQVWHEKSLSR